MGGITPSGSGFNADAIGRSLEGINQEAIQVQGEVKVGADNMGYLKVSYNSKQYSLTVGSDFVQGFNGTDTTKQQHFARQLSLLIMTMDADSNLKTAAIDQHQFSYNGKSIDLGKVDQEVRSLNEKIEEQEHNLPALETAYTEKSINYQEAQQALEQLNRQKASYFGKNPDDAAYQAAKDKERTTSAEFRAALTKKEEANKKIEQLRKEKAEYEIAKKFREALYPGTSSIIRVVEVRPDPAPASAAPTATRPPLPTGPLPTPTTRSDRSPPPVPPKDEDLSGSGMPPNDPV